LSVVKYISDEIAVMYLGQIVERASSDELFANPLHPYTSALLGAIPKVDLNFRGRKKEILKGEVVSPINPLPGCRFTPRCKFAKKECNEKDLQLKEVKKGHFVSCTMF
jgi:peptide/nickel transport system ATP-binding protein